MGFGNAEQKSAGKGKQVGRTLRGLSAKEPEEAQAARVLSARGQQSGAVGRTRGLQGRGISRGLGKGNPILRKFR